MRSQEKRIQYEPWRELALSCQIDSAQGIDEPSSHPELGSSTRMYRVWVWIDSEDEESTEYVQSWTNPKWGQNGGVPVDSFSPGFTGELSIEVERLLFEDGSSRDVATTSRGTAVVGRARVRLPELGEKGAIRRIALVRADGGECRPEGILYCGMELSKEFEWIDD